MKWWDMLKDEAKDTLLIGGCGGDGVRGNGYIYVLYVGGGSGK